MANKRLPMRKIREVLRLSHVCGLGEREVARSCRIARATVGNYLKRAEAVGLTWPAAAELSETEVARLLFPRDSYTASHERAAPDCQYIYDQLRQYRKLNLTLTQLWLEYKEVHPDGYQYTRFCEHYRRWRGKLDYCMRQEHRAGEKVFIDYADGLAVVDAGNGEVMSTQLFVAVWGASNYTYAEVVRCELSAVSGSRREALAVVKSATASSAAALRPPRDYVPLPWPDRAPRQRDR